MVRGRRVERLNRTHPAGKLQPSFIYAPSVALVMKYHQDGRYEAADELVATTGEPERPSTRERVLSRVQCCGDPRLCARAETPAMAC